MRKSNQIDNKNHLRRITTIWFAREAHPVTGWKKKMIYQQTVIVSSVSLIQQIAAAKINQEMRTLVSQATLLRTKKVTEVISTKRKRKK